MRSSPTTTRFEAENPHLMRDWRIQYLSKVIQMLTTPAEINNALIDRQSVKNQKTSIDLQTAIRQGLITSAGINQNLLSQGNYTIDDNRVDWVAALNPNASLLERVLLDAVFRGAKSDVSTLAYKTAQEALIEKISQLQTPSGHITNQERFDELEQQMGELNKLKESFDEILMKNLVDVGIKLILDAHHNPTIIPNPGLLKSLNDELAVLKTLKLMLEKDVTNDVIERQLNKLSIEQRVMVLSGLDREFRLIKPSQRSTVFSAGYSKAQDTEIQHLRTMFQHTLASIPPTLRTHPVVTDLVKDKTSIVHDRKFVHSFSSEIKHLVSASQRLKI